MAGMEVWLFEHWFDLSQTVILGAGLFATAASLRTDTKERKIQNLLDLTSAHREIWSMLYDRPQLNRILDPNPDLARQLVTLEEQLFVDFLILHLRTSFKARQSGLEFGGDAIGADIQDFFTLPIPRQVWEHSKKFQDLEFVKFVESNL
jgi:hypothetical protein